MTERLGNEDTMCPVCQEWPYLCSGIVPNSVPDQAGNAEVTLGTVGAGLMNVQ